MDRSADDPRPPRPTPTPAPPLPGQPLPRLVRFTTPDEPHATPRKDRRKARSVWGKSAAEDAAKKGVLEEQTPQLDTYETRRTIRLVVGVALSASALLGVLLLWVALHPGEPAAGLPDDGELAQADPSGPVGKKAPTSQAEEREAQVALEDARLFAQKQDPEQTLRRLHALVRDYPKTHAADEARTALQRMEQGLPLFVDAPLVIARPPDPEPKPKPEPAAAAPLRAPELAPVAAPEVAVAAPAPVSTGTSRPLLPPPPVTPEPRIDTGLNRERASVPPRAVPAGFRPRVEAGVHPSGWPLEITCDRDGMPMVFVPGGIFILGRDDGPAQERPAHKVQLSPYYIDQHEVTNRQFLLFLRAHGRRPPLGMESSDDRQPAVGVTAREAYDYAQWAEKTLPTEAQWEGAARTTDGRIFPWGAGPPAWDRPRQPGQIDPVVSHPLDLSPYGVFDLAGNVREWTQDWYDPRYFELFHGVVPLDPQGPPRGRTRNPLLTIKGGSPQWDVCWREGMRPEARLRDLGFRCVLPLTRAAGPGPGTEPGGRSPVQVPF